MPAGRFFFFNITGGVCWACLFGFGAYAVGAEIYKISGTLSVISLGLFIAGDMHSQFSFDKMKSRYAVERRYFYQIIRADDQLPLMAPLRHADRVEDVRFQGEPGRHLLTLSSSQFDPERT
jgi:hypothetical protein